MPTLKSWRPMSLLDALLLDPQKLDVWIALRNDGVKGTGTEEDPYDGSVRAKSIPTGITITHSNNVATVANATNHGYANGSVVVIAGVTGDDAPLYNWTFFIYGVTSNGFSYTMVAAPQANATGTLTCTPDPYQFDAVMRSLPTSPVAVHIGPGTFETKGYSDSAPASWQPWSGWSTISDVLNATTFKYPLVDNPNPAGGQTGSSPSGYYGRLWQ